MNTHFAFRIRHVISSFFFAAFLAATSSASIIVVNGSVTETFTAQPSAANWSTTAGLFGSGSNSILDNASADALVAPVTRALLDTQLTAVAGGTAITANQSRWYDSGFIGTAPTGVDATLTMVTLTNGTGSTRSTFSVSYDLASQNSTAQNDPEIPGHRVYWSLTGNANSWNPIGNFGTLGTVNFNVPVANWAANTDAYLLWLDDNGVPNPDGLYTIDNVRFTAVPEPSAYLLGLGALGVLGYKRLRRSGRKLLDE